MVIILDNLDRIEIFDSLQKTSWAYEVVNTSKAQQYSKGEGVKICLIDSGIELSHQEFNGKIKSSINLIDKTVGIDEFGHGTAIAGLLVGDNIGIAPDAELYFAKVLNKDGNGSFRNIIDGINYAINIKADILCMSLGTQSELPPPILRKIKQAYKDGMIIVCASGNNGSRELDYPARLEEVIAVGGFNKDMQRSTFTNYNSELDILAPSTDVLSSYKDGKYCMMSGTSMATPIVAGAIAIIKSYYKEQGVTVGSGNVKNFLSKNGNEMAWFNGYGNLNILKLLKDD